MIVNEKRDERRRGRNRRLKYLSAFSCLILLFIFLITGLRSSYITFEDIIIRGASEAQSKELRSQIISDKLSRVSGKVLGYANFLLWQGDLTGVDMHQYENIVVKPDFSNRKVLIEVVGKKREMIGCITEKCFWISRDGAILDNAPESNGQLMESVRFENESIISDKYVLIKSNFDNLLKIIDIFQANSLRIESNTVTKENELNVKLLNGPNISFSLKNNTDFIEPVIKKLQNDKKILNLTYIDFRIENKAYYK